MQNVLGFYWQPGAVGADSPASENAKEDRIRRELDLIASTGANTVYMPRGAVDHQLLAQIRACNLRVLIDWTVFAGKDVRLAHPDSVPMDQMGEPFDRDGWYMPACPNHAQLRRQHIQAITGLLREHGRDMDGLWLDFIRFPVRWERAEPALRPLCFCATCLKLFLQTGQEEFSPGEIRTHAATILRDRYEEWVAWKCRCVAGFVEEVRQLIDANNPNTQLGMFSLPWRQADFDGAIRAIAGQDLDELSQYIDCYSPMVYHLLCSRPASWIQAVAEDVQAWAQKPVLPIIQAVDEPEAMSAGELEQALYHALDAGGIGVMIFTLAPFLNVQDNTRAEAKTAVVREFFQTFNRQS